MSGYDALTASATRAPDLLEVVHVRSQANVDGLGELVDSFRDTPLCTRVSFVHPDHPELPTLWDGRETEGLFAVWWANDPSGGRVARGLNSAVDSSLYTVARATPSGLWLCAEVNAHLDASQLLYPVNRAPFVLTLGRTPDTVKAYVFDGSCGFSIAPGVFHNPAVPVDGPVIFQNRQGLSHPCTLYNHLEATGAYWGIHSDLLGYP